MYKTNSKSILLLCFFTYLTVYVLRVNFSSAMPLLQSQANASSAFLGMIGSVFFITYAVGQLVNGFLADSMSPFRFIIFGLIGTVLANAGIAFCNSLALIPVLWAVNGYFQSIFWASLTRLLSFNFEKKKYSVVATVMSSSMVGDLSSRGWCLAVCWAGAGGTGSFGSLRFWGRHCLLFGLLPRTGCAGILFRARNC